MYYNNEVIDMRIIIDSIFKGFLLALLLIIAVNTQAAPLPPNDPEVLRIESLPSGVSLSLSWNKHAQEADPGFGYIVYFYTDNDVTNEQIAATGMFIDNGAYRTMDMPNATCSLSLTRTEKDLSFRLKAYNNDGASPYSGVISTHLTVADLAGLCPPEGLTLTKMPTP